MCQDDFGGAEGGAFFNRGDVVVDGEAVFTGNYGGVSRQNNTNLGHELSPYA